MRRHFIMFFAILTILIAFSSVAYAKSVHVTIGNYEYDIKKTIRNEYNAESGFNYHYGGGSVYTGFYTTTYCSKQNFGVLNSNYLVFDELESLSGTVFDETITGFILSNGIDAYETIDIQVDSYIDIMPHRAIHFYYPGDDKLSMFMYMWIDWDYLYTATYSNPIISYDECKNEFAKFLKGIIRIGANANSRKNPANVGDLVSIKLNRYGLEYTLSLTIDELYRGDAYSNLLGKYARQADEGYEYVAVKATVKFDSIDSIISSKLGTDDPKIDISAIGDFQSYSSSGMEYDNVNYSISGMKELTSIYEGASSTGYFQFEIESSDPAPLLAFEPERDQIIWVLLK